MTRNHSNIIIQHWVHLSIIIRPDSYSAVAPPYNEDGGVTRRGPGPASHTRNNHLSAAVPAFELNKLHLT